MTGRQRGRLQCRKSAIVLNRYRGSATLNMKREQAGGATFYFTFSQTTVDTLIVLNRHFVLQREPYRSGSL